MTAYKEQHMLVDYSSLGLLMGKFTITHPSVVAVITATHVHVPLSSSYYTKKTSRVSKLRVLQNSRVSHKVMPCKRAETRLF